MGWEGMGTDAGGRADGMETREADVDERRLGWAGLVMMSASAFASGKVPTADDPVLGSAELVLLTGKGKYF
tara:strand:+ start:1190 stop:1402 length:213 start_codon:yes stop_codon:yes gene_type:complete